MYTPINWANPNNLELIKEKRKAERIETPQTNETVYGKSGFKAKIMDSLNRAFTFRLKPKFEM